MTPTKAKHSDEFNQAKQLFHDWKLDESKKIFTQLSHTAKNKEDGLYGLGMVSLQRKDLDKAENHFSSTLDVNSSNLNALYYLSYIAHLKGNYSKAHEALEQILAENPEHGAAQYLHHKNINYLIIQAKRFYQHGKTNQAAQIFKKLLVTEKYKAAGYYGLGVINYAQGHLEEAKADFAKCVKQHSKHANAHYYLGKIAKEQNESDESSEHYQRALKINPRHAGALRETKKTIVKLPSKENFSDNPGPVPNPTPEPATDNTSSASLPQNRHPYLSAWAGRLFFWMFIAIVWGMYSLAGKVSYGIAYLILQYMPFIIAVGLILFIIGVKKKAYSFPNNTVLSIEKGIFSGSVANYDLRYLTNANARQSIINSITRDGTLILKFQLPAKRGGAYTKVLPLKGIGKWNEIKDISIYLNTLLQQNR
jgi:tetratricopeptide (TPR) repeat protein